MRLDKDDGIHLIAITNAINIDYCCGSVQVKQERFQIEYITFHLGLDEIVGIVAKMKRNSLTKTEFP